MGKAEEVLADRDAPIAVRGIGVRVIAGATEVVTGVPEAIGAPKARPKSILKN